MGVYLDYVNSDEIMYNSTNKKIILNDLPNRTSKDKEIVNSLLMLQVGEVFDNVPRCSCGALSMAMFKGVKCPNCDTEVEEIVSDKMDDKVWVRTPRGVPALMNIKIWYQLNNYLSRGNSDKSFSLLKWLTDSDYRIPSKVSKPIERMLEKLQSAGMNVRGYNHFYENFEHYIEFLLTEKEFNSQALKQGPILLAQIKEQLQKGNVWVQHLQIPNRALTIVEKTNGKRWVDKTTPKLLKAVRLMVGIDNGDAASEKMSIRVRQNKVSRFLSSLSEYFDKDINGSIGSKPGLIRKNIIACRSNFTARFVVTAITGKHKSNEVHFPWFGMMAMFAPQIKNRLYKKYKLKPSDIMAIMTKYAVCYHPKLHDIMNDLIAESTMPDGTPGIPIIINRNPTLKHGSIVLLCLTKVKTDVRDLSCSTSGLLAPLYNGDYDGDEETFLYPVDNRTADAFQPFEPYYSVSLLKDPYGVDGVVNIPKQTTLSIATMMIHESEPNKENLDFMKQFV